MPRAIARRRLDSITVATIAKKAQRHSPSRTAVHAGTIIVRPKNSFRLNNRYTPRPVPSYELEHTAA